MPRFIFHAPHSPPHATGLDFSKAEVSAYFQFATKLPKGSAAGADAPTLERAGAALSLLLKVRLSQRRRYMAVHLSGTGLHCTAICHLFALELLQTQPCCSVGVRGVNPSYTSGSCWCSYLYSRWACVL